MKNYMKVKNNGEYDFPDVFEDPFEELFHPFFLGKDSESMKTDIKETEHGYELDVDMPGFEKSDIKVSLSDGYLTVAAKREEKVEDKKNFLRRERNVSCRRSYYVGDVIKEEDVKAKYDKGILSLTVPKKDEKELPARHIEIE